MNAQTGSFSVRPAVDGDVDCLFHLARAFATSFQVERAAFEQSFAGMLNTPDVFLAVACDHEGVIGYVLGFDHLAFFANGRVGWIEEVMVEESKRRQGAGRALILSFEEWARSRQAKLVALATRRAPGFYRAIGFEESATYYRKLLR